MGRIRIGRFNAQLGHMKEFGMSFQSVEKLDQVPQHHLINFDLYNVLFKIRLEADFSRNVAIDSPGWDRRPSSSRVCFR